MDSEYLDPVVEVMLSDAPMALRDETNVIEISADDRKRGEKAFIDSLVAYGIAGENIGYVATAGVIAVLKAVLPDAVLVRRG